MKLFSICLLAKSRDLLSKLIISSLYTTSSLENAELHFVSLCQLHHSTKIAAGSSINKCTFFKPGCLGLKRVVVHLFIEDPVFCCPPAFDILLLSSVLCHGNAGSLVVCTCNLFHAPSSFCIFPLK